MNHEEVERTIEFLLHNQAKHDAQIQALIENQAQLTTAVQIMQAETHEAVSALTSSMQSLANTMQVLGFSQIDLKTKSLEGLEGLGGLGSPGNPESRKPDKATK
ncbi:MAG: hypothetical protein K1Y36_20695 [Blastocatellia bacterium]|nr:hypothetical protein [Blastocatellia bacterium]